jgi:acetyl esterase/lipase
MKIGRHLGLALMGLLAAQVSVRASAAASDTREFAPGTTKTNLVYGMYSGLALLLDVKRPVQPNGMAVIYIPGSGFQAPLVWDAMALKDGPGVRIVEQELLAAGFTVVTVNHRAAPRFRYPAAVEDVQRAARFVRANAAAWGVSADKIAIFGGSSGGHLAAMLATIGEGSEMGPMVAPDARRPDCVVAAMAPLELTSLGTNGDGVGYTVSFMGHPPYYEGDGDAERRSFDADYREASPITHVSSRASRMLLLHGDRDTLVPIGQSEAFLAASLKVGAQVELTRMPGVGHNIGPRYAVIAADWLKRCMTKAS